MVLAVLIYFLGQLIRNCKLLLLDSQRNAYFKLYLWHINLQIILASIDRRWMHDHRSVFQCEGCLDVIKVVGEYFLWCGQHVVGIQGHN